jgi:Protein of unknown function, DUF547
MSGAHTMLRKMGCPSRSGPMIAGVAVVMILLLLAWTEVLQGGVRITYQTVPVEIAETQAGAQPSSIDVSDYDRLLHTYVTDQGWVDYAGLAHERGALNRFLEQLAKASPNSFKNDTERLAFWINSYNAFTLADALDNVYGKHQSVRQVSGFFDGRRHSVAGENLTLDEIEKRGRDLHDPRIHFAIVCASASCPRLQRFAYTGEALTEQLDQAARGFFADHNRGLRFDPGKNELHVSPILKWYAGDFTATSAGTASVWARVKASVSGNELLDFIARYAPADVVDRIKHNPPTLHYFDYDWSLNSLDTHSSGAKQ